MPTQLAEAPLVLVVDDQADSLDTEVELVRRVGCAAIGVTSAELALLEADQSPHFDAVLCDINLLNRPNDRSGVALAGAIRRRLPSIRIVGYSAQFSEEDLTTSERAVFDRWYRRADDRPRDMADGVRTEAIAARVKRLHQRQEGLARLRERHAGVYEGDVEFIRSFVPGSVENSNEEELATAGYRLVLITSDAFNEVANPVAAWVRSSVNSETDSSETEVEAYGHSQLGVVEDTEQEAFSSFIEMMSLLRTDLEEAGVGQLGPDMVRLHRFLAYSLL